jgi:hypothetical protein
MEIEQFRYLPVLKTTDAELTAYEELDGRVKDNVLPLFELTKSRRTKKNPVGPIEIRLNELQELTQGRLFILDLTQEPSLSNTQIDDLLGTTNDGYKLWRKFVADIENVIPVIHYNEEADAADNIKQARELERQHQAVAFRIDVYDPSTPVYFRGVVDALRHPERLVVILDAGYVSVQAWEEAAAPLRKRIKEISKFLPSANYFSVCSSFPKTVVAPGYGADASGEFNLVEIDVHESANREKPDIKYGDYGSIHPVRYPMGGGGWIPRIDAPLDRMCFYHRERASDQGNRKAYIKVAKRVFGDKRYKKIQRVDAWGDTEIQSAAEGNPHGINPSHWIAVRANLHITRQYFRTKD